ncbi:hypothetical protein FGO68_gene15328 [Halteria grandinella]|uniref:Uncharacterized protein n=1 Tax=Halteria grandinella TaxID=5974 RepID=A0A8J8NHZ4_HALGN|nr:hypothetical protein FGO68_gene15328 [Halteria grandinella]
MIREGRPAPVLFRRCCPRRYSHPSRALLSIHSTHFRPVYNVMFVTIFGSLPSNLHDDPILHLGHLACLIVQIEPHRLPVVLVLEAEVIRIAAALEGEEGLDISQGDIIDVLGDCKGIGHGQVIKILWHIVVHKGKVFLGLLGACLF